MPIKTSKRAVSAIVNKLVKLVKLVKFPVLYCFSGVEVGQLGHLQTGSFVFRFVVLRHS